MSQETKPKAASTLYSGRFDVAPDAAVFGPDAQPVLSFRGSVTQEDWTNNALQGLGQEAPHYSRAMELATAVNRTTGGEFEVTGHSLGGGLASAAAAVTGVDATLFNAAGLHASTAARFIEAQGGTVFDIDSTTTTWQVQGDVLTEVQASAAELNPDVAQRLADAEPDRFVANMSKAKRKGRLFIDYLRNERGATAIAPFSTRSREGAPCAVPISWKEVETISGANIFSLGAAAAKAAEPDPWPDYFKLKQAITATMLKTVSR